MNSKQFLEAAKKFAETNRANVTIEHLGVKFVVKYLITEHLVIKSCIEYAGLQNAEAERMFHALFIEAGND